MADVLSNIHPGEVLLEDFIQPLGLSQDQLARKLGIPPDRLGEIVRRQCGITPDTALRLARYFGTSSGFWLGLQLDYDVEDTKRRRLERIRRP